MATITEDKAEVEAALAKLHAAVEGIHDSVEWTAWLKFLGGMHNYSALNRLWMWCQWEGRREAQAVWNVATGGMIPPLERFSMPAAFSFWKDHGRMVTKGEKALTVLAPIMVRDDTRPKVNGKAAQKCIGFRLKSRTFDVAQTTGADIPANPVQCEQLTGAGDAEAFATLAKVATLNGWTVSTTMPAGMGEENGVCIFSTKSLHVDGAMSGAQQLKTLIHEVAHSLMHTPDEYALAHRGGVETAEVEAESVAYLVADRLGIDSSAYSVGYVASWSRGNGAMVAKSAERVLITAERIVSALETGALPAATGAARLAKVAEVAA